MVVRIHLILLICGSCGEIIRYAVCDWQRLDVQVILCKSNLLIKIMQYIFFILI